MEMKILIIDDDDEIAEIVSTAATASGLEAFGLTDSGDLDSIDLTEIKLIFLDLAMPKKDGIEVLKELSEKHFSGSVVLMSGFDVSVLNTAHELAEEYRLNVLSHLAKPFRLHELNDIFDTLKAIKSEVSDRVEKPHQQLSAKAIQKALGEHRFFLHYQPQVDLITHQLVGMEALVRLQSTDDQIIYPEDFLSVAEEEGIIYDLTRAIVQKAFEEFRVLLLANRKLTLSINLSTLDLQELDFSDWMVAAAEEYEIPTQKVILEVTETQKILSYANALNVLSRLRLKGFKVSIDDFGTGNAVLDQVKKLPITELKIDQTFVEGLSKNDKSKVLIKNIISMSRELDLDIVVEGVEDLRTEKLLVSMGCQIGQGFLYAKPMSFNRIKEILENEAHVIPTDTVCTEDADYASDPVEVQFKPNEPKDGTSDSVQSASKDLLTSMQNDDADKQLSFIIPLSGRYRFIGQSIQVGAQLAFEEGLKTQPNLNLGLSFYDDQSDLEVFFKHYAKLPDKTLALVEPAFAIPLTSTFLKKIKGSNLPIIAPFNGCQLLRTPKADHVFNFKPGFIEEVRAIVESLKVKHGKIAFFVPKGKFHDEFEAMYDTLPGSVLIEYTSNTLDKCMAQLKALAPHHVIFFGAAKTLVALIEEVDNEFIHYYATSLVGTGMVKKLLGRKAQVKLQITEPLPNYQSDIKVAKTFRKAALDSELEIENKLVNSISFEAYLVTQLLLQLYLKHNQSLNRASLESKLKALFGYDLGLASPLSWAEENRQLLHNVYRIKV
ncbi:MAG: EAL domain-containing protein [Hydrogenovibrio sp.]|nr:EAL domain-containing protein [Hydrogenovibrio sp.]